MVRELTADQVRRVAKTEDIGCETSDEAKPITSIIGQKRAVKALNFGLGIDGKGFNIFISGQTGTGRTSAAKEFLERVAKDQDPPDDWVYVHNFKDSYQPKAIRFEPGKAREFRNDINKLIDSVKDEINRAFSSDEYADKKEKVTNKFQEQRNKLVQELNEYARSNNFSIQQTPNGFETVPLNDKGRPLSEEEYNNLTKEQRQELEEKGKQIQKELREVTRQIQKLEQEATQEMQELNESVGRYAIDPLIDNLKKKYQDNEAVIAYLDEVVEEIISNMGFFRGTNQQQAQSDPYYTWRVEKFMKQFEVNVLIDNSERDGAPVEMEQNPTYNHLFGKIEKESQFGTYETDFTLIRPGALHRANGGYIIIPVVDLISNMFSWESLIRALKNEELAIEDMTEKLGFMTAKTLRPEPIPLDIKVVLIGQPSHYRTLYSLIDDFRKLFKVKSEFDSEMDRDKENVDDYVSFICKICSQEDHLNHLHKNGLGKIIEYGSRLAGDQQKLSTHFREIMDIIEEADYYAKEDGAKYIDGQHVTKAIDEKIYRSNLIQEKITETINEGTLIIDVEGKKVGEVNGLAYLNLGDISFGKPSKITASLGLGRGNVVDIEREAELGGPIHSKGVMILSGYLMNKYALKKPMNLSIRLVFEQNYSGVDGDSASSTEIYAILSEIADIPIKQNIAVTGSVNQKGLVQAIGGVNEKIEGFFEICKQQGFTGDQGVMIPQANVKNLMLKEEVRDAVDSGNFHIWPVSTIDEGFEVLSDKKAGKPYKSGNYPKGTFNAIIDKKLKEYNDRWQSFHKQDEGNGKKKS